MDVLPELGGLLISTLPVPLPINTVNIFYTWFRRATYTRVRVCVRVRTSYIIPNRTPSSSSSSSRVLPQTPQSQAGGLPGDSLPWQLFYQHHQLRREHCRVRRTRIFFYHPLQISQLNPTSFSNQSASFQFGWELLLA